MMGATFPVEPIKPEFHRGYSDAEAYVRLEYRGSEVAWLVREVEGAARNKPAFERTSARRTGFSLRALAAKVASLLF